MTETILLLIYIGLLIFLLFYGFVLFFLIWHTFITKNAPYVPIPKEVLPEIFKALQIDGKSIVYDLGSGDGRVLFHLYGNKPEAKYLGIDISPWPIASSKIRKWKNYPNSSIEFKKGNILNENVSEATHVFTYLFPQLMDTLLPKLEKELKEGTTVVSCDYYFSNKKPIEIIDLNREKEGRGKKLYVYKF